MKQATVSKLYRVLVVGGLLAAAGCTREEAEEPSAAVRPPVEVTSPAAAPALPPAPLPVAVAPAPVETAPVAVVAPPAKPSKTKPRKARKAPVPAVPPDVLGGGARGWS